jgi:hypothetical protein
VTTNAKNVKFRLLNVPPVFKEDIILLFVLVKMVFMKMKTVGVQVIKILFINLIFIIKFKKFIINIFS